MQRPDTGKVSELLHRMSAGDGAAAAELMPLVYGELHALAGQLMQGQHEGHTLQPTALVNEAFLRLAGSELVLADHRHFLGVAAKAMRSVLVDHARRKHALKRAGDHERVPLDEVVAVFEESVPDLLALDEALERLCVLDPELGRIVELRFFGGLSVAETARVLGVSEPTIVRGWHTARLWLRREL